MDCLLTVIGGGLIFLYNNSSISLDIQYFHDVVGSRRIHVKKNKIEWKYLLIDR